MGKTSARKAWGFDERRARRQCATTGEVDPLFSASYAEIEDLITATSTVNRFTLESLAAARLYSNDLEENPQSVAVTAGCHRFGGGGVHGDAAEGAGVSGEEVE